MKRAVNLIRAALHYRKESFDAGLQACGFKLESFLERPRENDVLVVWNRYGAYHDHATHFEASGGRVLVVENGYLGKGWRGGEWFAMAAGHHLGAGRWQEEGGPERWDSWGVELAPWRTGGEETIVLAQRGIGEPGISSPPNWAESVAPKVGGRIRAHPGNSEHPVPLSVDLKRAEQVVTWHSAAALWALMAGIPVWYAFPQWIGARAGKPLSSWPGLTNRSDADRLEMFRRLAWAQWTIEEIKSGKAIASVLGG